MRQALQLGWRFQGRYLKDIPGKKQAASATLLQASADGWANGRLFTYPSDCNSWWETDYP